MGKVSKIVTLKLSSDVLKDYPVEAITPTKSRRKSSTSKPADSAIETPVKKEATTTGTPIPNTTSRSATPSTLEDGRRKARGGRGNPKGGKRSLLSSPAPADIKQEGGGTTPAVKSTLSKSVTSTGSGGSVSGTGSVAGDAEEEKSLKAGTPVRKWVKKPVDITSFTGYNIEFKSWTGEGGDTAEPEEKKKKESFKVQIRLNNKKLGEEEEEDVDSRDQSPLPASSIVSTPEGSNATPV